MLKDVTYVKLDGDIGVFGNGAGLVMSTLDVVALAGGRPANFATSAAWWRRTGRGRCARDHQRDLEVKSILFNIFGGSPAAMRWRAGSSRRFEQMDDRGVDRRATGRHECGGGERASLRDAAPKNSMSSRRCLDAAKRAVELAA